MREIKFRVWEPDRDRFLTDYQLSDCRVLRDGSLWRPDNSEPFNAHNGEAVFMQYTGLKDKNGQGIYEGDIVNLVHNEEYLEDEYYSDTNEAVVWDEKFGEWSLETMGLGEALNDANRMVEIIGNIYEQPELLKEKTS